MIHVMRNIRYIILISTVLLVACAKQAMPSGGAKDDVPPRVLGTRPESGTLEFCEKQFVLDFDEYIVVKDADNNVLISPPLATKPEFTTKGHSLVVKLKDTLAANTTYLFQFKEAIADYNEGNLLSSFEYVFSTGDSLAGQTLRGTVLDAQTLSPRKEAISVMLYNESQMELVMAAYNSALAKTKQTEHQKDSVSTDSTAKAVPDKVAPTYVTRADKQGNFQFNYIAEGTYYVVALEDGDKNMQIGLVEPVAFTTAAVSSTPMPAVKNDSAQHDSSAVALGRTAQHVASQTDSMPVQPKEKIQLLVYEPVSVKQRITSNNFKQAGLAVITSLMPMKAPQIEGSEELEFRLNKSRDTMTLWTLRQKCDSLRLVVSDPSGIQDTLTLRYRAKRNAQQLVGKTFSIGAECGGKMHFYDSLWFSVPMPVTLKTGDTASVRLLSLKDSSLAMAPLRVNSTAMRAFVDYPFKPGEKYQLHVAGGALTDLWKRVNDSLNLAVEVSTAADYGNLKLSIAIDESLVAPRYMVQLLDEKGAVVQTRQQTAGQRSFTVRFNHIIPGKYRVRLIVDANGNGQWDGGDFATRLLPETVRYYVKNLDVRANWDMEEIWQVDK